LRVQTGNREGSIFSLTLNVALPFAGTTRLAGTVKLTAPLAASSA